MTTLPLYISVTGSVVVLGLIILFARRYKNILMHTFTPSLMVRQRSRKWVFGSSKIVKDKMS